MPFDSPDLNLGVLLRDIATGKVQLPDFQREWKWDDDRIASLLASVGRGHPVGVLMLLETGGDGSKFAPKPIAGAVVATGTVPELLVLDGQQRLTSLYQSLASSAAVSTTDARGKKLKRWYYVDMTAALESTGDLEDAIRSIPEDRMIRDDFGRNIVADYSTTEKECAADMFPLNRVFDMPAVFDWQRRYLGMVPDQVNTRVARWDEFYQRVLHSFVAYTVPSIVLKKDTPKDAVCTVFEKVNTGGVPLNVFELLTATFAADNFRLKDDWAKRKARLDKHPSLRSVESTDFLQSIALLATRQRRLAYLGSAPGSSEKAPGIGCKRRDMLGLGLSEYEQWADVLTDAYEWAASFLAEEYIFRAEDVPYRTQLVPLTAIRVVIGKDADNFGVRKRLRQWYWSGVLGELYGGTTETRFARDVEQVPPWLHGGPTPNSVIDAGFREQRLLTLRTRNSAAYKGMYALLMRGGSADWMKTQPMNMATFFDWQVDIHHIFPKSWCEKNGIDQNRRESIVNKTAISRSTNITIGGRPPGEYLETIENKVGISPAKLDEILRSHAIDPARMRSNDFDGFFQSRANALLDLVGEAMGKEAIREPIDVAVADEFEAEPEEAPDEPAPEELAAQAA